MNKKHNRKKSKITQDWNWSNWTEEGAGLNTLNDIKLKNCTNYWYINCDGSKERELKNEKKKTKN